MKPLPMMDLPALPKMPSLPKMPAIPGMSLGSPTGAPQKDVAEKVVEIRTSFMERAKAEAKRVELVTDTEYWCCLCFETREQKEAFLEAVGMLAEGDKYLDGRALARKLGAEVGPKVTWPKTKGLSERLNKHVE